MFLSTLSVTTAHVPIIKSFLLLPQANALRLFKAPYNLVLATVWFQHRLFCWWLSVSSSEICYFINIVFSFH